MSRAGVVRSVAVIALLSMLSVACGQKEGVHGVDLARSTGQDFGGGQVAAADPLAGVEADQQGEASTETSQSQTDTTDPGSGPVTDTPDGQPSGDQSRQREQGGERRPDAPPPRTSGDTTGVSDTTIKIGLHAPLTGAAPVPQTSFATGKDLYWRHVGKVHGRTVEVFLVNDEYNPSRATSVCNDLIQREKVYILIGGAGTDQISACARTAANQGVPYLSAGVDEGQVRHLRNYLALSMTYIQQAPMLIQWIKKYSPPPNGKFGIMRDRTPGFNAVVGVVKAEAEKAGWEVLVRQVQNPASDAQWLAQNQIKVAFPMMTPSVFLQVVRSPGGSIDQWAGIGITMGLNTVSNTACAANPGYDGSMFFSPVPGLNIIDQVDPEFRKAGGIDDIELLLWGVAKSVHQVFQKMSPEELSRQAFIRTLENNELDSRLYPKLKHSPSNHMNAQGVHLLFANCDTRQYETPPDGLFRTSF